MKVLELLKEGYMGHGSRDVKLGIWYSPIFKKKMALFIAILTCPVKSFLGKLVIVVFRILIMQAPLTTSSCLIVLWLFFFSVFLKYLKFLKE